MPEEIDHSKAHTDEVDEIIGKAPPWVIRRGNIVIGCVVLMLLAGAWLIRYPDVVSAPLVISVTPPDGHLQFAVRLPVYKTGKIGAGQKVLIKLREYPFEEFGMLTARVQSLSRLSPGNAYTIQLELENGYRTNRNRLLDMDPEITGTADIIVDDKSLWQRIFRGSSRK